MQASAGRPREGEQRGGGRDFEKARFDAFARVQHLRQQRGQLFVVDQPPGDADALVEAHQVRAGEGVHAVTGCFQRSAQECAGRAFAVGAGDVEHRRQAVLRSAEPVEKLGDPLEPEPVAGRRQLGQAVELRLDRVGACDRAKSAIRRPLSSPARG